MSGGAAARCGRCQWAVVSTLPLYCLPSPEGVVRCTFRSEHGYMYVVAVPYRAGHCILSSSDPFFLRDQSTHFQKHMHQPMTTDLAKAEAWRFCDVCDPLNERAFSAERAYITHLSSRGHLKKSGLPLPNIGCPAYGKRLSRESDIPRHLYTGKCPGRQSAAIDASEFTRKHGLSISPNGIAYKMQKTAACDFGTSIGVQHAPVPAIVSKPEMSLVLSLIHI